MLRGKWWEIFKDPELNALEEQLNVDNPNIKQSFENFMQARATGPRSSLPIFPTASATPSYSRSRSSGGVSSVASVPLDISWAPDLWGKVRKTVQEFQYSAQLSAADLENERLTEQASLASFFFEIRGQDALQKVLNDTVEADKKSLELTKALYETGIGDQISVVQAQTT